MSRLRIVLASFTVGLFIASAIAADKQTGSDSDHAIVPTAPALTPTEQKIKSKLDQKVSINLADRPLSEWIVYLSDKYHLPIQFDTAAIKDAAIDPSTTPVGMQVKDSPIRSALKLVLGQHNLTYVIADDVLLVTTQDKANAQLTLSIYDVRDLVSDANHDFNQNAVTQLTTVITATLAAPTWSSV